MLKIKMNQLNKKNSPNIHDNMLYEILNIKNDFYLYKYCSKDPKQTNRLINKYYYD